MEKDKDNPNQPWKPGDDLKIDPPMPLFRELPPTTKFPLDALGSILSGAGDAIRTVIQAPDALIGQCLLGGVSLATQAYVDIKIDGRRFPVSLFLITVGTSGERKSAVDTEALLPHREAEKEAIKSFHQRMQKFELESEAFQLSKKKSLVRKQDKSKVMDELQRIGPPPCPPRSEVMLIEEPTYEGLVKALIAGRPSVGLFSDEGGRMVGGHGMNADNQLKTAAGLCGLWDGKPISRTRAGEGSTKVFGKRLSLHLLLQPRVSERLTGNVTLSDQGFLSRCLVTFPETTVGSRPYRSEDLSQNQRIVRYRETMREILTRALPIQDETNELVPTALELTPGDKALWVLFHNHVEENMREGGQYQRIRGFANKAAEQALRIAGVLTAFENIDAREIGQSQLEAGIHLMQFYLTEAIRLHDCAILDPQLHLAQKLLEWCQRFPEVHLVQIYQFGPNAVRDKAVAVKLIRILEDHRWLKKIPNGKEIDGKHRKDVWEAVR